MTLKSVINTAGLKFHLSVLATAILLTSCASVKGPAYEAGKSDNEIFNQKLRAPKGKSAANDGPLVDPTAQGLEILPTPTLSVEQAAVEAENEVMPTLSDENISRLAFNNMPVSAFINEVFGNQLGINYVIEPSIKNTPDLVTMRITSQIDQKALYRLATNTLKSYGVTTSFTDEILSFSFSEDAADGDVPLIVSGKALPEVPNTSRPVFFIYPLTSVTTPSVRSWITQLFPRNKLDVSEDIVRNALILKGNPRLVNQAVAAVRLFDRPSLKGMYSRIIRPTLSNVEDLSKNLEQILLSEGYAVRTTAGTTAIRLLALESTGQLVVFAKSPDILEHVMDWAKTLETEKHNAVDDGLFSYQVQSTQATHIVNILNSLGVANYVGSSQQSTGGNNSQNRPVSTQRQTDNPNAKGRYAVDEQLNTILYSGSGKDWLQVLPVIKRLDKAAPSVMVEVILAEVQLNDNENFGIEWLRNTTSGDYNIGFGTLTDSAISGGLGLGSAGFSLNLDNAGSTRAVLNAFYKNEKANIRSRPRIMVKSGGEASIDVGNEIPVITSNSQSTSNGDSPVIQNINYRKTGVILEIKPTVHASGFVDIEITQELSEATATSSSNIDSPTILNRKIRTTVTLRDGGSVLLGGLISSTSSAGEQGVPVLGRLPLLGNLFKTETNAQDRTELMVMIIPYVLNSPEEAENLTDELQRARIENLSSDIIPQSNSSN